MEVDLYKEKLIYLAGLFDGEGSVLINYVKDHNCYVYRVRISVSSTCLDVVSWAKNIWGGNVCIAKQASEKRKECYAWELGSNKATNLLEELLPYLIIKKERALIAIAFQRTQKWGGYPCKYSDAEKEYRTSLFGQLRNLNGRVARQRRRGSRA